MEDQSVFTLIVVLFGSFFCATSRELLGPNNDSNSRDARTLIVNFPNPECTPRFGDLLLTGFCDSIASCLLNNGRKVGFCTGSTNICCLVTAPCGSTVATKTAYFLNPDFPATTVATTNCAIRIKRYSPAYDQVKLTLQPLNLDPPDANGNCVNGFLQITGSATDTQIPLICGINSNQILYINFGPLGVDITLTIVRTANSVFPAQWSIQITQILTNSLQRAPDRCLQYFTGNAGTVTSFNFEGGRHLSNQEYNVCIQRTSPACVYTWNVGTLQISEPIPVNGEECLADDSVSFSSILAGAVTNIFCGDQAQFPGVATTSNVLQVSFDDMEPAAGVGTNTGFQLPYTRVCP